MVVKYNQKYWLKRYDDKEDIKEWFKNYLTYLDGHFHTLQDFEEIKKQFLKNEYVEIKATINTEKNQQKCFNFVKNVIENISIQEVETWKI